MLWIFLALLFAVPVLLGLVPGTDATWARRHVLRCTIAGAVFGLLVSGSLFLVASTFMGGATIVRWTLSGALTGAYSGLLSVVVRRFLAGRRT